MFGFKKFDTVKTTITYKVPAWTYCNHKGASTDTCRFLVRNKHTGMCVCSLYNEQLDFVNDTVIKTDKCLEASKTGESEIDTAIGIDNAQPVPQQIIKETIKQYIKIYNGLRAQGYPESLASKAAKDYLVKEGVD